MENGKVVDSYKFLDVLTRRMAKSWQNLPREARTVPWTEFSMPVSEATVALISSAGLALKSDQPFDQEGERRNPWWGDPSFRVIPRNAVGDDLDLHHLHLNPDLVRQDLNTLFPLEILREAEQNGTIKNAAAHHYSYMGYLMQPQEMLDSSVPKMIKLMKADQVDAAILVPG